MSGQFFDPQAVPASLPVRGNAFSRSLGFFMMRISGWRIEGCFPDVPKMQIIVAPHTSNWDFISGIQAVFALGIDAHWVAKHTLFKTPLGPFFRWLGGVPVDRTAPQGAVEQIVEIFATRSQMMLAITPEGTRKKVHRWKSGFYRIANQANVPLVPIVLDYRRKVITILPPFEITGDYEADLPDIQNLFRQALPRRPACF